MQNYTLNNYLTDYQFNPDATDKEIMLIAEECSKLNFRAKPSTIKNIVNNIKCSEHIKTSTISSLTYLN